VLGPVVDPPPGGQLAAALGAAPARLDASVHPGVLAVLDLHPRHVDRRLMARDHGGGEVPVGVAGQRRHGAHHRVDGRLEPLGRRRAGRLGRGLLHPARRHGTAGHALHPSEAGAAGRQRDNGDRGVAASGTSSSDHDRRLVARSHVRRR
jgi:hypothetical protein